MKNSLLFALLCTSTLGSAQSGITWNMAMNISGSTYSNMHPRIALDRQNNPMVVWGRMTDQSVLFSRWNGTVFTTPVSLNPMWLTVATGSWQGPDIASYGDTVYVVVKQTPEAIDSNHIYIMTSFNAGVSFGPPVRVDFIADSISRFPSVTTDSTGNPIVAFMKFDASFGDARWVVTRSLDYGNTFTTDVKASGQTGGLVCDCCPGSILNTGNDILMLYRANMGNIRDSWAGISYDGGTTFPAVINIDQNNWNLFACPSSAPDGVRIGDTLYSVFMNGASGISRTYLSTSSVSNTTIGNINLITGNITGLGQQNYPRIATAGHAMAVVWKQSVNNSDQLPLLFTNNYASGLPASYDTVDLNNITNADVALSDGNIFVVWQDDGSNTVKYRSGSFIPVAGIKENGTNNFSFFPNPANSSLNIFLPSNENCTLCIFNSQGKKIYSANHYGTCKLQTNTWLNGIYFFQLQCRGILYTQKFLKQ